MKKTKGLFCEHAASRMRKNIEFAAHVILSKVEDFDYTPEEALRATVTRMGTDFFTKHAKVPEADVLTFVEDGRSLGSGELRNYLAFFGLESLVDAYELKHVNRRKACRVVVNLFKIGHRYDMDSILSNGSAVVVTPEIAASARKWSK